MRETKSARLTRMHDEYDILRQVIPAPACALHFSNPLELLIATVLSAQTTDKRVNTVTPELFATYPPPVTWRPQTRPKSKTSFIRWGSIVRKPSISSDWPRHWTNDSAAWCRARWMN